MMHRGASSLGRTMVKLAATLLGLACLYGVWSVPANPSMNPDGFTLIAGRLYYIAFFEEQSSADAAAKFCSELLEVDMKLVSFETPAEYEEVDYYLLMHFMGGVDFWSGGRRHVSAEGTWGWEWQDGSPVTWFGWGQGQPDELWREDELCVSFRAIQAGWEDRTCQQSLRFICEQQK